MKNKTLRREYTSTFFKGNRLTYFVMLLSALLFGGLNLIVSWLIQQIVDTVSGAPGALGIGTLAVLSIGIVLLVIPFKALEYASQPLFMRRAMTQFKCFLFEKLLRKNMASFHSEATGVYLSAFSNDLTVIESNYLEKQFTLAFNLVWGSGAMLLMLAYNPLLTITAIGFCVLPFIASAVTGTRLEKAEAHAGSQHDRRNGRTAGTAWHLSCGRLYGSVRSENHPRRPHRIRFADRHGNHLHQRDARIACQQKGRAGSG